MSTGPLHIIVCEKLKVFVGNGRGANNRRKRTLIGLALSLLLVVAGVYAAMTNIWWQTTNTFTIAGDFQTDHVGIVYNPLTT